jgi:Asp-tRNA(Asn)/Glu-tRNA(Gln) amidotransferase A subunit family amidase
MRIGIPRRPYWEDLDPTVAQVLGFAIDRLREAGATFVDVEVDNYYKRASDLYNTLVMHGIKEDLGGYLKQIGSKLTADEVVSKIASKDTRALFGIAHDMKFTTAQIEEARTTRRDQVVKAYEALFRKHGLSAIVFPTEPIVAPLINTGGDTIEDQIELNGRKVSEVFTLIRNTHVTGALGAPGLSVPAGLNIQGLPVGFEFDGLPGRDRELLALGIAVEQTLGNLPPPRERRS